MKKGKCLAIILIIFNGFVSLGAQEDKNLVSAYQREFIYLDNEIRLLEQRISEVKKQGDQRVSDAEKLLDKLEEQLFNIQDSVSKKTEELNLLEEESSSSTNGMDTVLSVINQGTARLEKFGVSPYTGNSDNIAEKTRQELSYVFTKNIELLKESGSIRVENGNYFLPSGKQVEGQVYKVGQIASLGLAKDSGGTLAPAGEGLFHLVRSENSEVARKLIAGEQPQTLPLFIYESIDKLIETGKEKTIKDVIDGGGIIGFVIIGLGLIAIILVIIRAVTLLIINGNSSEKQIEDVAHLVETKEINKAVKVAKGMNGAISRVLQSTLNGLFQEPEKVEDTIAESVLNEQPGINRFKTAISVFAAVAPLLGLLGTVTGMIATFDIITLHGTGDPKLLSGGISEALVTTELGLIVAIPTLLLGNLLSTWADSINSRLEISALKMVNANSGFRAIKKERA